MMLAEENKVLGMSQMEAQEKMSSQTLTSSTA
jgi:hypothetical protein